MNHETSDLYLAAALCSMGHKLTGTSRRHGKMHWIFGQLDLDAAHVDFMNNKLLVPARTFADNVRRLKAGAMAAARDD